MLKQKINHINLPNKYSRPAVKQTRFSYLTWSIRFMYSFVYLYFGVACQSQTPAFQIQDKPIKKVILGRSEQNIINRFQIASPSVVHITSKSLLRGRFSLSIYEREEGTGSGFIWDKQGHIVTNYHVIKQGNLAQVALHDEIMHGKVE